MYRNKRRMHRVADSCQTPPGTNSTAAEQQGVDGYVPEPAPVTMAALPSIERVMLDRMVLRQSRSTQRSEHSLQPSHNKIHGPADTQVSQFRTHSIPFLVGGVYPHNHDRALGSRNMARGWPEDTRVILGIFPDVEVIPI